MRVDAAFALRVTQLDHNSTHTTKATTQITVTDRTAVRTVTLTLVSHVTVTQTRVTHNTPLRSLLHHSPSAISGRLLHTEVHTCGDTACPYIAAGTRPTVAQDWTAPHANHHTSPAVILVCTAPPNTCANHSTRQHSDSRHRTCTTRSYHCAGHGMHQSQSQPMPMLMHAHVHVHVHIHVHVCGICTQVRLEGAGTAKLHNRGWAQL